MFRKLVSIALAFCICAALVVPAFARSDWFDAYTERGRRTPTLVQYWFVHDEAILNYNKELTQNIPYRSAIYSGSELYIPIGANDTSATSSRSSASSSSSSEEEVDDGTDVSSSRSSRSSASSNPRGTYTIRASTATDKQIKDDNVQVSYTVIKGADYVESVELVSGKKEKLNGLPSVNFAKITFAHTYMPLDRNEVQLRLVLSVNGVSYQETATSLSVYVRNRVEEINRNSVYGALIPAQFKVVSSYGGDATFDFGDNIKYTGRVGPNKRYYLNLDREDNAALKEMYPDAYLEFYDFKGYNDTFEAVGTLEIPISKSKFKEKRTTTQLYAYEIVGDRLSALDKGVVSYNDKTGMLSIKTSSLGSYVLSSRALMKEVKESSDSDIIRIGYADGGDDDVEETQASSSRRR